MAVLQRACIYTLKGDLKNVLGAGCQGRLALFLPGVNVTDV